MISPTPAGPADKPAQPETQTVETINQVFALFRLNYHNQYYAAWSDAEQVKQVKRLWLEALAAYPTAVILRAAQHAIESSDYLPTLNKMIDACRFCLTDLGLPTPYDAYREACLAPSPNGPTSACRHPTTPTGRPASRRLRKWRHHGNTQRSTLRGAIVIGFSLQMSLRPKPGPCIEDTTNAGPVGQRRGRLCRAPSDWQLKPPIRPYPALMSKRATWLC